MGQEVARLSQSVATAGAGLGSGLALGIAGATAALLALQAAGQAAARVVGTVTDQLRAGLGANVELERATVAFRRLTGSAEAAGAIIAELRREAAVSPFNDQEVIAAGAALITSANGSTEALLRLVRVAEQLAVLDPVEGLRGGVFALREALSGDFQSLIERFEIPRTLIQRLREEGVPNLEIVRRALEFRGIDASAIEAYGRTFEGRIATIQSFGNELRQLATSGAFRLIGQALAHLVNLVNRFGDDLRTAAEAIGEVFATLAQRVAQGLAPLLDLLDTVLPGLGEAIRREFATPIEEAGAAAAQARPQLEALREVTDLSRVTRHLADVGVAAAQLQIDAERLRRSYDDQLRPLERQRELLRTSAELQQVQNALAANRASVERTRLQAEVQALQRAARGATDPNAAGLSQRQRAIALALQERELRLEELALTEEQRPALQAVDQQIDALRRAQADALAPLERSLELRREEAALLQLERERLQQVAADAQRAAGEFQEAWRAAGGPDDATQAQNKATIGQRAQELAEEWLARFEAWVDANGGNAWTAIARSLTQWALETGVPLAVRIGALIAQGIFAGISAAWDRLLAQNPLLQALLRGVPGGALLLPQTRDQLVTAPTVEQTAADIVRAVTVNVGGVQVDGQADPALEERLKQALVNAVQALVLTGLTTEPGATPQVQGAGRTP